MFRIITSFFKIRIISAVTAAAFSGSLSGGGICLFSLAIIVVILLEVWFWQRVDDLQKALNQIKWPFIGKIYQNYYYVILSGLATFLKSGLSLQDILTANEGFITTVFSPTGKRKNLSRSKPKANY